MRFSILGMATQESFSKAGFRILGSPSQESIRASLFRNYSLSLERYSALSFLCLSIPEQPGAKSPSFQNAEAHGPKIIFAKIWQGLISEYQNSVT
jgi:hypothetical protein